MTIAGCRAAWADDPAIEDYLRRFSARTHLLGLIAVAILPVWLFAAYLLTSFALSQQQGYRDQAVQIARQSAAAVDGELKGMLIRLDGLARSLDTARPDLAKFHADARRLVAGTEQRVSLHEIDGRQLLNTEVQFGAPLPTAPPLSDDEKAGLQAGRETISGVTKSDALPIVSVSRPITTAKGILVLDMTVPASFFVAVLKSAVPTPWVLGVADRDGFYVTRSARHEEVSGTPGLPEYLAKATGRSGTFTSSNRFGETLLAGYVRSDQSGWLYAANIDLTTAEAPLWKSLFGILGIAAIALVSSIVLAYLVGRTLTRETDELMAGALALGTGQPVRPVRSRLKEFESVSGALVRSEMILRERTQQLEAVVATAPVAVWFTYDQTAREVIRNRFAAELMGLDLNEQHYGKPDQVVATLAYHDGEEVSREDRPLSRAMRGEPTDNQEFTYVLLNGHKRHLLTSARPILDSVGAVVGAVQISVDITERKRDEEQLKLLARELNHRVKNNLAVVQSIAHQTLRYSETLEEAREALIARLSALGGAHHVLTQRAWREADIREIIETTVFMQASTDRVYLDGPAVALKPNIVMALSLVMHELSTNAVKYGSLSADAGTVFIRWSLGPGNPATLNIDWEEKGGPTVREPEQTGFGSKLLKRITVGEGGTISISFAPDGLKAAITLPV